MSAAIEIEDLTYRPGRGFLLDRLSMTVPEGAVYGFLGPNGAGKTTTIKLLLGMHRLPQGRITVLGERVPKTVHRALARTGYVPETPHLYPSLRVDRAIDYHAAFYSRWDAVRANELLDRFALRPRQRVGSLSKGETRKLMVLLALSQRPDLLVLDEPTDGLDPVIRRDLLAALSGSVADGTTVLISSHLVHELEGICDWVAVIDRGVLAAEQPMSRFRDSIKVLTVHPPPPADAAPFEVLEQHPLADGAARWTVRGWQPEMREFLSTRGGAVRRVEDVDLESAFVATLEHARRRSTP